MDKPPVDFFLPPSLNFGMLGLEESATGTLNLNSFASPLSADAPPFVPSSPVLQGGGGPPSAATPHPPTNRMRSTNPQHQHQAAAQPPQPQPLQDLLPQLLQLGQLDPTMFQDFPIDHLLLRTENPLFPSGLPAPQLAEPEEGQGLPFKPRPNVPGTDFSPPPPRWFKRAGIETDEECNLYAHMFRREEVDISQIPLLNAQSFEQMGLTKIGNQIKIKAYAGEASKSPTFTSADHKTVHEMTWEESEAMLHAPGGNVDQDQARMVDRMLDLLKKQAERTAAAEATKQSEIALLARLRDAHAAEVAQQQFQPPASSPLTWDDIGAVAELIRSGQLELTQEQLELFQHLQ